MDRLGVRKMQERDGGLLRWWVQFSDFHPSMPAHSCKRRSTLATTRSRLVVSKSRGDEGISNLTMREACSLPITDPRRRRERTALTSLGIEQDCGSLLRTPCSRPQDRDGGLAADITRHYARVMLSKGFDSLSWGWFFRAPVCPQSGGRPKHSVWNLMTRSDQWVTVGCSPRATRLIAVGEKTEEVEAGAFFPRIQTHRSLDDVYTRGSLPEDVAVCSCGSV